LFERSENPPYEGLASDPSANCVRLFSPFTPICGSPAVPPPLFLETYREEDANEVSSSLFSVSFPHDTVASFCRFFKPRLQASGFVITNCNSLLPPSESPFCVLSLEFCRRFFFGFPPFCAVTFPSPHIFSSVRVLSTTW